MPPLADLDAYLERIGLDRSAGLFEVHRAHATTIPFENFASYAGERVPLDVPSLEDKLVTRRRGGYCFEHNLLLRAALESLGIDDVTPMLARVRLGPPGAPRPRDHLLLRVVHDGEPWLADVGFGGGGLLDPVPLAEGAGCDQSGWRYRLVSDDEELVLQVFQDGEWSGLYGFVPRGVPEIDIEMSNWYTATHPSSPFVNGIIAGARGEDRYLSLFANGTAVLIERPVGERSSATELAVEEVPEVLSARFSIDGVSRRDDGRLRIDALR